MFVTIWGRQKKETTGWAHLGVFPTEPRTQGLCSCAGLFRPCDKQTS